MRLSKIKLSGFKTFVDSTTIKFPSNLMGIVGPNGCGKSNIIDGIRWRDALMKNVTLTTSVGPDFACDFPLAMQWIGEGRIDVRPLLTHTFPLSEIQTAFETFSDRKDNACKVLIRFPAGV